LIKILKISVKYNSSLLFVSKTIRDLGLIAVNKLTPWLTKALFVIKYEKPPIGETSNVLCQYIPINITPPLITLDTFNIGFAEEVSACKLLLASIAKSLLVLIFSITLVKISLVLITADE